MVDDLQEHLEAFLEVGLGDQFLQTSDSDDFQDTKDVEDLALTVGVAGHIQEGKEIDPRDGRSQISLDDQVVVTDFFTKTIDVGCPQIDENISPIHNVGDNVENEVLGPTKLGVQSKPDRNENN